MKGDRPNDPAHDPQLDDNDPVWRLLARASRPEPDAWFVVRTLARCRHVGLGGEVAGISFREVWRWALGSGLGLCLAVAVIVAQLHPGSAPSDDQKKVQEAFDVMASLGTDSDSSSSSSSWQDSSL